MLPLTRLRLDFSKDWIIGMYLDDERPVWRAQRHSLRIVLRNIADWQERYEAEVSP